MNEITVYFLFSFSLFLSLNTNNNGFFVCNFSFDIKKNNNAFNVYKFNRKDILRKFDLNTGMDDLISSVKSVCCLSLLICKLSVVIRLFPHTLSSVMEKVCFSLLVCVIFMHFNHFLSDSQISKCI